MTSVQPLARAPYVVFFNLKQLQRQKLAGRYVLYGCAQMEPEKPSEHFRASKFSGGGPQKPPHTVWAPLFIFALGPHNPLGGPAWLSVQAIKNAADWDIVPFPCHACQLQKLSATKWMCHQLNFSTWNNLLKLVTDNVLFILQKPTEKPPKVYQQLHYVNFPFFSNYCCNTPSSRWQIKGSAWLKHL